MKNDMDTNKKLIIDKWQEFKISRLFVIKSPSKRSIKSYDEGTIPYVSSGSFNNGIISYLMPKNNEELEKGNCITVSPLDGSSFYQENDFLGRGGAGSAISLLYNDNLSKYSALFICTIIKKSSQKFGYNDALTSDNLKNLSIKLPVLKKPDGTLLIDDKKLYSDEGYIPDFSYMEKYMKSLNENARKSIDNLHKLIEVKHTLADTSKWNCYKMGGEKGLFNIVKGKRLTKANMIEGDINFIGSSSENNGITNHISNSENLHKGNLITVSYNGSVGEAFYQEEPFVASDDVNVFYPNFEMNKFIALYLCAIIRKEGKKYAFINKWKKEEMEETKIYLPTKEDGSPDWKYMEQYIIEQEQKCDKFINAMNRSI